MEIYTIGRPSALPAACAPVSAVAACAFPVNHESVVGHISGWRPRLTDASQLPQVHQVSGQAELTQGILLAGESYGTNGFTVKGIRVDVKQPVVGVRGVPPRGRPV